jgi:hypothetical protein
MPSADLTPGAFLGNSFNRNEWSVFHRRNSPIMKSMPRKMPDLLKRGCDPPYISKEVYAPHFVPYLKWVYARARDQPQRVRFADSAGGPTCVRCGSPRSARCRSGLALKPKCRTCGVAAAGGIAMINSIGNIGGFVAPNLKTLAEQALNNPTAGMICLGVVALLGSVMMLALARIGNRSSQSLPVVHAV